MKKYLKIILITLSFIAGCANPLPPSGGPPDKTPPTVLETEPKNGTLNFSDNKIFVRFDKYMDKSKVAENIFISPTKNFTFDWSGKKLYIKFEESLDTNTTYCFTLGTDYTDIYQNKPAEAFQLTFSTGSSLDSGIIKGKLFDQSPQGVNIVAYRLEGINPDTLNPTHTKPYSRTQVGTSGNFEFRALKNGKYRVFAIRDKFKDGSYDEGIDGFGASPKDYAVTIDSVPYVFIKVGNPIDKSAPMLYSVESISRRTLVANFSEELDSATISPDVFVLTDSTKSVVKKIISAYFTLKSAKQVIIHASEDLETNKKWLLKISTDSAHTITDTLGLKIQDSTSSAYFLASNDNDTTKLQLFNYPVKDSSIDVNPDCELKYIFTAPIKSEEFNKRISLEQSGISENVAILITKKTDNVFTVKPKAILANEAWYTLNFRADSLYSVNGVRCKDSIYKFRFKTKDIRNYGGVKGTIKNLPDKGRNYYLIMRSKDGKNEFKTPFKQNSEWEFQNVPPALYTFEIFEDLDGDGKYSYGRAFPFKPSERFYSAEKEIEIKPRWIVEGVTLIWLDK
ncbi:MAG: Ig-like domain-containing protein [Bacteroidota bacterium]|jgi:uncharacterized protein (DUF2141 family)